MTRTSLKYSIELFAVRAAASDNAPSSVIVSPSIVSVFKSIVCLKSSDNMSYTVVTNLVVPMIFSSVTPCKAPAGHASACLESSPINRPNEWSSIPQNKRFTFSSLLFLRTNARKYPIDIQSSGLKVTAEKIHFPIQVFAIIFK